MFRHFNAMEPKQHHLKNFHLFEIYDLRVANDSLIYQEVLEAYVRTILIFSKAKWARVVKVNVNIPSL